MKVVNILRSLVVVAVIGATVGAIDSRSANAQDPAFVAANVLQGIANGLGGGQPAYYPPYQQQPQYYPPQGGFTHYPTPYGGVQVSDSRWNPASNYAQPGTVHQLPNGYGYWGMDGRYHSNTVHTLPNGQQIIQYKGQRPAKTQTSSQGRQPYPQRPR